LFGDAKHTVSALVAEFKQSDALDKAS